MTTETQEQHKTAHALDAITNYIRPGTNEGISWTLSRLTDDLFNDSLLAGGDLSLFTGSGLRGTLNSQESNAYLLPAGGAATPPSVVPISLAFDLNEAVAKISWTPPGGSAQHVSAKLELYQAIHGAPDAATIFIFNVDRATDQAGYQLLLMLL
jgi:hypothetical protein